MADYRARLQPATDGAQAVHRLAGSGYARFILEYFRDAGHHVIPGTGDRPKLNSHALAAQNKQFNPWRSPHGSAAAG